MRGERRAAAARNGCPATAILIVATAFVTACDGGSEAERAAWDGTSERSGVPRLPRALANTRAVDPDRLMAILYIDGLPTVVERDGSGWSASFDLRDRTTLQASWVYETGTGRHVVERSVLVEIDPGDPARAIVIEDYDTRSFDDDVESNLSELRGGRDPLSGVPEETVALVFESRVDRGSGEVVNVLGDIVPSVDFTPG